MNREFVEKWISALRSGEYKQCRTGQFAHPSTIPELRPPTFEFESFCCLGVANFMRNLEPSDISELDANVPELNTIHFSYPARIDAGAQTSLWCHLTAMNDGDRDSVYQPFTFEQIADVLEQALLVDPKQFSKGPTFPQEMYSLDIGDLNNETD
jgi:hypothetical protein